tara:strand:- start:1206 stop:2597 length:1392 start_codon:yes stop_codon:yes gene_type:complete
VKKINIEAGSFRDPAGRIFYYNDKVYRVLSNEGLERYRFLKKNNLLKQLIHKNYVIRTNQVTTQKLNLKDIPSKYVLEHDKVNYISYPYEWSFQQLKDAAIHHLNLHLYLLNNNATLIDASAYNIQFVGHKPLFIDILSIKEYDDGEYWKAHKQFCENFLNPLILKSKKNINFNNWFKGNLEGITTKDLNSTLGIKDKISYNIFVQVVLLNYLENKAINSEIDIRKVKKKKFPKNSYISILKNIRNLINSLKIKKEKTIWGDYSTNNTYKIKEENNKKKVVEQFSKKFKFKIIADLGCNDGVYSQICLANGCKQVIGFDYDLNSINKAFRHSKKMNLNFLPLYLDASNPSPDHGWLQSERKGFMQRANFSGMLALAFEHHLAIAKNVPLDQVINFLTNIAPRGLIEFVPKDDYTVEKMISLKGDIFEHYNEENFKNILSRAAKIISEKIVSSSGRKIFEYSKI